MQSLLNGMFNRLHLSLRWKLALLFGLPMLLLVMLVSFNDYNLTRSALSRQVEITSVQLGDIVLGGLDEAMLKNDRHMIRSVLAHIGQKGNITRVSILDLQGVVRESAHPAETGVKLHTKDLGCNECHQYAPGSRPRMTYLTNSQGTLRVITPINNNSECQACHPASLSHLGILLIDTSLASTQQQILAGQRWHLTITFFVILMGVFITLGMVQLLVIRRIEVIQKTLAIFQKGDLSTRIHANWHTKDELTDLAENINLMADALSRQQQEQIERANLRQQAIIEERERIARELHDGVAQFLGYVNTKIIASRLLLKKRQIKTVENHLSQIEQAVRDQSLDVRSSIIGLKMDGYATSGLVGGLRSYFHQFSLFTDFSVEFVVVPDLEQLKLNPETELHLVRIVQEALSNVRKHAGVNAAQVSLTTEDHTLTLAIHDDGVGFNPWQWNAGQHAHFGLQTMRERADHIGAQLSVLSEPGCGTTICLRLELEEP